MPDGTILYVRRYGEGPAVLLLPGLGETVDEHDLLAQTAARHGAVYLLELRGHRLSEGRYSLALHRRDLAGWLQYLAREHGSVYLVAHGLSALLALEHEMEAHSGAGRAAPDGMVLIDPRPGLLQRRWRNARECPALRLPHRIEDLRRELSGLRLGTVRVQTPTVIVGGRLPGIVGNVRTVAHRCAQTDAERVHHAQLVARELAHVMAQERPIRFRIRAAPRWQGR